MRLLRNDGEQNWFKKHFNTFIMKKIILLIVILSLNKLIYSQPFGESIPAYQIIELKYENSSGEIGTTFFRYNNQNKLIKALWMLENNSRYSTNFYEYDARGNLVSAFRDFSDGLTSYESFNYDTAGNKISEFFYRSDSTKGSATYTYNGNQLMKAIFNNYKGWLNGELDLEFNNKNQKEKGVLLNNGKILCKISYDYDSIGNLIKEFWDFNGKWNQTFRYIYVKKNQIKNFYSSPFLSVEGNYRISREEYTYNNEIGGPSLYFYNENGLLVKKVFIRDDSLTTNTFYEYDNIGKLISSKRFYSDGNIANFIYNYDEYNNLIRRDFIKADTLYGFESYLYNSDGELTKAYFNNFDGWLSGTINFSTNGLGKVVKGEFKGEDGFDASIVFSYNKDNLPLEIIWEFTFGKFQKYRFEYEQINSP